MYGLGQQILARTGLAQDHHRNVAVRYLAQLGDDGRELGIARVQVLQRGQLGLLLCPTARGGAVATQGRDDGRSPGAAGLDLGAAPYRYTVVQAQLARRQAGAGEQLEQRRDGQIEQRGKGVRLQRPKGHAQLELRAAVGRQKAPLGRERGNALDQRAQELGA